MYGETHCVRREGAVVDYIELFILGVGFGNLQNSDNGLEVIQASQQRPLLLSRTNAEARVRRQSLRNRRSRPEDGNEKELVILTCIHVPHNERDVVHTLYRHVLFSRS